MKGYVDSSWIGSLGYVYYGPSQYCESVWPYVDRHHDKPQNSCQPSGGNPIYPLTGTKRQSEVLVRWSPNEPPLSIVYDNRRKLPNDDPDGAFAATAAPSFGALWESGLHKRLFVQMGQSSYYHVQVSRGAGAWVSFIRRVASDPRVPDSDVRDRLLGVGTAWRYFDADAQSQESYDVTTGAITAVAYARGGGLTHSYSDSTTPIAVAPVAGLLVKIQDQYGRALRFEYEQPTGVVTPRIARVIDPNNQVIQAGYDAAGNLERLTWPDAQVRRFMYEQSALPWALTGIVDENSERHSTYAYDAAGRAQSTEYAGGVNRFSVSYGSAPRWVTTETFDATFAVFWRDHNWQLPQNTVMTTPNGTAVNLGATLVNGMPRVTTRSQPAGAGCDASSSSLSYDANGNIASKTDFNGSKSCHAYDLGRNLETARIEGLSGTDACPADIGVFTIATDSPQRKTTTQWHPDWSLPGKQAEPKQITTSVYNGQPDPTAGNAIATCAPTSAVLPDGKRIAVLCKKVEQANSDMTGSLGFAATPVGTAQVSTWTYNQYGQTLTARDPLNKLTSYAYYSDTTADHTLGDLQRVTDSKGRVTQYTRYDRSGRLRQSIDANGTVTDTSYTPRGWVQSISVTTPGRAPRTSTYNYDGVGQLKKATLPDEVALQYTYDAAHRLTGIKDSAGNSVTYTLDNMGNRTGGDLKDPGGNLLRNATRVYDALNRVQSTTGGLQ